jgi:hypothetical protein
MSDSAETARAELIQALHRAARIERAEAVKNLLRKLIWRGPGARAWPASAQPAVGDCR